MNPDTMIGSIYDRMKALTELRGNIIKENTLADFNMRVIRREQTISITAPMNPALEQEFNKWEAIFNNTKKGLILVGEMLAEEMAKSGKKEATTDD